MTPNQLEKEMIEDLKRMFPEWCRHVDGTWRVRATCGQCQLADFMRRVDRSHAKRKKKEELQPRLL